MKAGIYARRDNGKLVYIAKDRSIRAFELLGSRPCDGSDKVTTSQKEQVVSWAGQTANRICDVPNGCTDSVTFLANVRRVLDTGRVIVAVNGIDDFVTEPDGLREYQQAGRDLVGKVFASLPKGAGKGGIVDHDGRPAQYDAEVTQGGAWFDEELKTGDIIIEFADNGQDFLRWLCREDEHGFTRVIDCQPYQGWLWNGTIVHNAENLTLGRGARLANVTTQSMTAPDAMQMSHDVIAARRVTAVTDADWAPLTEEQIIGLLQTASVDARRPPVLAVRCGADSLLQSAQAIREAGVAVPPHIARKIIDEYRAEAYKPLPGASEPEARIEEPPIDRLMRTHNVDIVNQFAHAEHELQILLEGERRGCLKLMAGGEINVLDLDAYEKLRASPPPVLPVLPKGTVRQYISDARVLVKPKLKDTALAREVNHVFLSGNVNAIPNDGRRYTVVMPPAYPVIGRPMPKSMKRHGAEGVIAHSDWAKAVLQKLQTGEIRLCGKQSKRKHRKAGHFVFWFTPLQSWAWEVKP